MSKYTPDQLKQKAQTVMMCKEVGDTRYTEMIMRVMLATGLAPNVVTRKIEELAHTGRTL